MRLKLFSVLHSQYPWFPFFLREGMKLEAIDPEHQSLICVVSVAEVQGAR
jgi:hypothetical protein